MPKLSPALASDPARLLMELNRILDHIDDRLDYAVLRDRKTGDIDVGGKRLRNVGRTKDNADVPSRTELSERGMYENPKGEHVAHSIVVAPNGIRSLTDAREPHELITLGQARRLIGASGSAVVTTNVDQYVRGDKLFAAPALTAFSLNLTPALAYHNQSFSNTSEVLGTFLRVTGPVTNFTISGLQRTSADLGGAPGMVVVLWNKTNVTMVLQHDVASLPENRFLCPNNANITVAKNGCITIVYSDFDKRWVVLDRN